MTNNKVFILYTLLLLVFTAYTWGFMNANFPYTFGKSLSLFLDNNPIVTTATYISFIILFFAMYGVLLFYVRKRRVGISKIIKLVTITIACLLFAYPAFSNDIFNYIATAKITFLYKENPYLVKPIEIPNEPMLAFMHAANKIALYGPSWIVLSAIPHYIGAGNLLLTMLTFKIFVGIFYCGLLWLLWKISNRSAWAVAFFGLNPLVVTETFVSGHNDVVMMFFALTSFYFLQKKKILASLIAIIASILIKYATVFLIPIYVYIFWRIKRRGKIIWGNIWVWSSFSMFAIFLLSPLREEIYAWYFIWILPFIALIERISLLTIISVGFSFGLLFRIAPYILTKTWIGYTPLIKNVVTFMPPFVSGLIYVFKKKI